MFVIWVVMATDMMSYLVCVCRPQCPQAAILVAATDDAYVSCESVMELHQHWPGSEVRSTGRRSTGTFIKVAGKGIREVE